MTHFKTLAWAALVALIALAHGRAHAQAFDTQQLRLVPSQQANYFGLHSARTLDAGSLEAGLVLHYANDPLVVVDGSGERVGSIVSDQLVANALFAFGVLDI